MRRRLVGLVLALCGLGVLVAAAAQASLAGVTLNAPSQRGAATDGSGDVLVGVAELMNPAEGATFNGPVAEFHDAVTSTPASGFHAAINWGDGTVTPGTITGGNGSFLVRGVHAYAEEGLYPVTVTLAGNPPNLASASAARTSVVADAPLDGAGARIVAPTRRRFSAIVAKFADEDPGGAPGDYSATINWGDGHSSRGVVLRLGGGARFIVVGSHFYSRDGSHSVTTVVTDMAGSAVTVISPAFAAASDLRLSLKVTRRGNLLVYRLAATNRGPSVATPVVLRDRLPAGTVFARLRRGRWRCVAPRRGHAGTLICRMARLRVGGTASMTVTVSLRRRHAKRLTDFAAVSSGGFDPRRSNNRARISSRIG